LQAQRIAALPVLSISCREGTNIAAALEAIRTLTTPEPAMDSISER
jgi:hypothetical protein